MLEIVRVIAYTSTIYENGKKCAFTKISDLFTKISDLFTKISDYGLPYYHITIQQHSGKIPSNYRNFAAIYLCCRSMENGYKFVSLRRRSPSWLSVCCMVGAALYGGADPFFMPLSLRCQRVLRGRPRREAVLLSSVRPQFHTYPRPYFFRVVMVADASR